MTEEKFECPECGKVFGSEETLKDHSKMEHGRIARIKEDPVEELREQMPDFRKFLNASFGLGLLIGIILTSAAFGGYLYWESLDHRTEVPIKVVTCDNCSYDKFQRATDRMFKTSYTEVDYQSEEGQQLIQKYNLKYVPGFVFNRSVENAVNFSRVKPSLVEFDDAYVIPDEGVTIAQRLSDGRSLE